MQTSICNLQTLPTSMKCKIFYIINHMNNIIKTYRRINIFYHFKFIPISFHLDNFISELRREDLQTLATSLKVLDLSGNSLTSVPEGIFWDLQRLESLDLSRNNIIQIHSMAFQNGVSPMISWKFVR